MRRLLIAAVLAAAAGAASAQVADLVDRSAFRVCADPANAPLSMQDGSGFENKVAELIAASLGVPVEYTWFPQAVGFTRNTLRSDGFLHLVCGSHGHEHPRQPWIIFGAEYLSDRPHVPDFAVFAAPLDLRPLE